MTLRTVELGDPAALNRRWALLAAVWSARGWGRDVYADGPVRHYHDGGGNWARMALLPQGRAILFGNDHEYSETYWGEAAAYFEEPETDLLAGAPTWWGEAVAAHREGGESDWIGFVYGWEDAAWQRADYDLPDGFRSVGLPAVSDDVAVGHVCGFWSNSEGQPDLQAVRAALAAGPDVTADQLRGVLPGGQDLAAGAAAAHRFRLV